MPRFLHLSPPLAFSHQTSVDSPRLFVSQSMASATSDYLVNVSCRPFIRPWVTGPLVPTSSSLTLPVPPGTTLKGGLTVVRNPSAAYRIPRTERRSQVEEDARGYTVFAARSPRYADVSQSIPGLKGIEVLNTDIRVVSRQTARRCPSF